MNPATSQLLRISSNYARLGSNLLLGIVLVPVLLHWLGSEGFGLYSVVLVTIGLASIFEEITRSSLIRELAAAYHAPDANDFSSVFSASMVLSIGVAGLSLVAFAAVFALVPVLNIAPELVPIARVMVAAEGLATVLQIALAPLTNMYLVKLWFVADNAWMVARRSAGLVSALFCWLVLGYGTAGSAPDPAAQLAKNFTAFTIVSNVISVSLLIAAAGIMLAGDARLRHLPRRAHIGAFRAILPTFGWNVGVNLAMNMYDRVGGLIMNFAFGLQGSAVWGIAIQLAAYVRMMSLGVNSGVDAVAAKLSTESDAARKIAEFSRNSTRLHALVSLPTAIGIALLTEPMIRLWVGRVLENPQELLPKCVIATQILLIPITARAISDCWSRILYGAGYVARYARLVLLGGLINPALASILVWGVGGSHAFYAPAASYALVYTLFHMLLLPIVGARCLQISTRDMLSPILRPLAAALIPAPVLIIAHEAFSRWTLPHLGLAILAYGVVYALACWFIVLRADQRDSIAASVNRALGRDPDVPIG